VKKDDGRVQAYGWSLPTKIQNPLSSSDSTKTSSNHVQLIPHSKTHVPVPVPVYCRPLLENETTGSKIWCAAGVDLRGCQSAVTRVGGSTFSNSSTEPLPGSDKELIQNDIDSLNTELKAAEITTTSNIKELSSLVWICTTTHKQSRVAVVDANDPAQVIDQFEICSSCVLSISSVPGASASDFNVEDLKNLPVQDLCSSFLSNTLKPRATESIQVVTCQAGPASPLASPLVSPSQSTPPTVYREVESSLGAEETLKAAGSSMEAEPELDHRGLNCDPDVTLGL
jgi:hypothetical protein